MPPIVMGPPLFVTLSNIRSIPTTTGFTLTFDTDQPVLMAMDYWSQNDPSITQGVGGSVLEGVLTTHHSIATAALPAGNHTGYVFGWSLRLDANDVSGLTLRSQQGFVQLLGARASRNQQVPIRFNKFGVVYPPAAGGGAVGTPMAGNWSTYSWAQYATKAAILPFTAAASSTQPLRSGPGYVYTITCVTAGTTAFTLHDDAGSGTGPVIYTSPASTAVGQVLTINLPFTYGLTLVQGLTGPSGTVQVA